MASIFPSQFRDIGSRFNVPWVIPSAQNAIVDGWPANFAGIVGGETVTIATDAVGATVVTFLAGDVTAALVAARINASAVGAIASVFDSAVRLQRSGASGRVNVTAHSSYAAYLRFGIPIEDRNKAAAGATFVRAAIDFRDPTRLDLMSSSAFAIPSGANVLGVWARFTGNDANGQEEKPVIGLAWENSVEPGGGPFASIFDWNLDPLVLSVAADGETSSQSFSRIHNRVLPSVLQGVEIRQPHAIVPIPPGSTGIRVQVGGVVVPVGNTLPAAAPNVSVALYAGAR